MKHTIFLNSEFALGRLKELPELQAIAAHWNEEWASLRAAWKRADESDREFHLKAADMAATQAWRVESLIERRKAIAPRQLSALFAEARIAYLETHLGERAAARVLAEVA